MERRALTGYVGLSANMVNSAQTVPGVQGGTRKALENYPRQQGFKANPGNNRAKGKAPWN